MAIVLVGACAYLRPFAWLAPASCLVEFVGVEPVIRWREGDQCFFEPRRVRVAIGVQCLS